jgi:peptide/nickel transport system substrate-binding protein
MDHRSRRPRRLVITVVAALAILASACGDDDDDSATATTAASATSAATSGATTGGAATASSTGSSTAGSATTAATPSTAKAACTATVPGSSITFGVFALTANIDPPFSSGALVGGTELVNFYDTLMRWDQPTNTFVPKLAESLTPNTDFTQWTLKLRPNIKFSDGTPLDATAVLASMDRFTLQGVRNNAGGYLSLISARDIVDPLTIKFTLKQPWATFGFALADEPGEIVNVKAVGADVAAFGQKPPDSAGVGPYTLVSFSPNDEIVYKARPDYWGGPVCMETIHFKFIPGSKATYDAYKAGDLDIAFLRDANVIATARADGVQEQMAFQDAGNMFTINQRPDRPGANPLVREAIVNAMDENVINERAFAGKGLAGRALINPKSPLYDPAMKAFPHDPERAKAALQEAKAAGYDGKISILCPQSPPGPDICIATEAMLQAVGFETTQEILPQNDQIGRVATGDYDLAQYGYNVSTSTLFPQMQQNLNSASSSNRTKYADPAMDAALAELAKASTSDAQKAAVKKINDLYVADNHSFVFGASEEGVVFGKGLSGVVQTIATTFFLDQVTVTK